MNWPRVCKTVGSFLLASVVDAYGVRLGVKMNFYRRLHVPFFPHTGFIRFYGVTFFHKEGSFSEPTPF